MSDEIVAKYEIETPGSLEGVAEAIAGEQSTGTFIRLPGETAALRARHAARVTAVLETGTFKGASLNSQMAGEVVHRDEVEVVHRGEVTISYPLENVGTALPNILTTVAGNLFELRDLTGVRLVDIEFPAAVIDDNPGPAFGVDGTRTVIGVWDRPIVGTIVKPSVGLTPGETAALVEELAEAGVDFVKDDELMGDSPHSRLADRVLAVLHSLDRVEQRSGRRVMYAANITNNLDAMLRGAELVSKSGGTCVMVSMNSVGLAALRSLRERVSLPIHGHRNGWGALTRYEGLGFSFRAHQKFWRLSGVDHLHVNGLRNKFWEPDQSVLESAMACQTALGTSKPVMPVFSAGQSVVQVEDTYQALKTTDLMYLCGGAIMAHPDGARAGVESLLEAWEAAVGGVPSSAYAQTHPALRRALETFA